MSIPSNSGFQEPPKVSVSDIINFQLGRSALQASFTKALQESDAESVVIVNIHQPIQPTQVEMFNARVMKNAEKKRTSLNQQIRDIIHKSIKASKHSKNTRTDASLEDKEKRMFVVDHNRGANKQLRNQDDKISEDSAWEVPKFDKNIRSSNRSSLDTEFLKKPEQNLQEYRENSHKALQFQKTFEVSEKKESLLPELIDNELVQDDTEEQSESRETFSKPESSIHTKEEQIQQTDNIIAPLSPVTTIASSSSITSHCIMSLPPDFFELFEKLVGLMIIEQNTSGITDVTVTIHRPGSILDKSEVLLQFFDTNPRSCNVELRGSPEAVHYFHKYHGEFVAAFQQSKLSLDVNIRKPALLPKKKIIKRKK